MLLFGVLGKFGALFVTIPDPVIGGVFLIVSGKPCCLFRASSWGFSLQNSEFPPNGCQIVCSKSFFSVGSIDYEYIRSFLSMDNKHRIFFSLFSNQKGAVQQNTLCAPQAV